MNVNTGELIRLQENLIPEGFIPVPKDLEEYAMEYLNGKASATVDMTNTNNPLVHWAKSRQASPQKSKKNKKHSRRKISKASRKANK